MDSEDLAFAGIARQAELIRAGAVLVDSVTTWVAALMDETGVWDTLDSAGAHAAGSLTDAAAARDRLAARRERGRRCRCRGLRRRLAGARRVRAQQDHRSHRRQCESHASIPG